MFEIGKCPEGWKRGDDVRMVWWERNVSALVVRCTDPDAPITQNAFKVEKDDLGKVAEWVGWFRGNDEATY